MGALGGDKVSRVDAPDGIRAHQVTNKAAPESFLASFME